MGHRVDLRARPTEHFCYSGRSLLVTNLDGRVTGHGIEGFYVDETRMLSRVEIMADGRTLTGVAASPAGADRLLAYAEVPESPTVPAHAVYLELAHRVGDGLREEVRIANYSIRDLAG